MNLLSTLDLSNIALISVFLFTLVSILTMRIIGKRVRYFKTIEFKPPSNLSVSQVGYILDGAISNQEITALIIEWAYKGYIKITYSDEHLGTFILKKIKDIPVTEFEPDRIFFESLFSQSDEIHSRDIQLDYFDQIQKAKIDILAYYKTHKEDQIFIVDAWSKRLLTLTIMIPLCFYTFAQIKVIDPAFKINMDYLIYEYLIGTFLVYWWSRIIKNRYGLSKEKQIVSVASCTSVGLMFYFIIIITLFTFSNNVSLLVLGKSVFVILLTCFSSVVISLLDHRSRKGAELLGKILGLKEFIETSEIDRIIELTNEDSQFFYKLLPYATVFGLTDLWSSKFEFVPKVKEGSDVLDSLPTYDPLMLKDLGLLINLGHIAQKNFEVSKTFSQLSKPDGHYDALKDNPRTPVPHLGGIQSKGSIRGIFETIDFFSSLFSGGGFGGGGGHHW